MTTRRTTSADVARRAGVSRATVSYVLNDTPNQSIPESTRQRVLEAVLELGYTPHAVARALRAGASRLVLLVNTGVPYGTNLSAMIDALATAVAASGRSLVVWQQNDPHDLNATLEHLQPVVVLALSRLTTEQRDLLARARIPYAEAGMDQQRDPSEALDHGSVLQVRHLADRGHRRIGYLTTVEPQLAMFAEPRVAAVEASCAQLGLPAPAIATLPAPAEVSVADVAAVLRGWRQAPEPVTGVACYNDVLAAACLAAAATVQIDVPRELAVVGMDDEPMSAFTSPPLTTVRLQMADYAADLWRQGVTVLNGTVLSGDSAPPVPAGVHVTLVQRASS